MALARGTKLGPYEITCPLGKGGVGEAYRATDRLERARKEGKPSGRPRRIFDREQAQRLREAGKGSCNLGMT